MTDAKNESCDWRTYFAQLGPRLILYARQWLPVTADAEDAVQEAFIRFWRKHRNPDDQHTGLLFAAVRHSALDRLRSESRRKRRESASAEHDGTGFAPVPSAGWFVPATSDDHILEDAVQRLATEQREVIVLKIWGELTFAQIGEVLGTSPHTAASRYRYAIKALRKTVHPALHE